MLLPEGTFFLPQTPCLEYLSKTQADHLAATVDYVLRRLRVSQFSTRLIASCNAQLLREAAGRTNLLPVLCEAGVLEPVCDYSVSHHSRKYAWTVALAGEPIAYSLRTKPALSRWRWCHAVENRISPALSPAASTQVDLLLAGRIKLEEKACIPVLLGQVRHPHSVLRWRYAADALAQRFWANQCQSGRLYTTVCNLPKVLRRHLLIDGRPTAEIDINACHPLISAALCKPVLGHLPEWSRYKELCESGSLYRTISVGDLDRAVVKRQLQILFNSSNEHHWNRTTKRFAQLFPNITNWMIEQKSKHGRGALFRLCTPIESNIMLGSASELINHHRVPCVSIHDSLCVPVGSEHLACEGIMKRFSEWGIVPRLTHSLTEEIPNE